MSVDQETCDKGAVTIPDIPALCVNAASVYMMSVDGELQSLNHDQAHGILHEQSVLVCHAPYVRGRLNDVTIYPYDVLELFAFVHPGRFCVPTPHGLAHALGLTIPQSIEDYPFMLVDITRALLEDLRHDKFIDKADPLDIAKVMGMNGQGWVWTPFVCMALGHAYDADEIKNSKAALNIWRNLPEWAEDAPEPAPSHHGVSAAEIQTRLDMLRGQGAEKRVQQVGYAQDIAKIFSPLHHEDEPHIVLAEAGTGVGKTLGYLAPASVWAEKNKGSVWISTYTKNLQRQIDQELERLYPDAQLKEIHTAIRKGRENYLCLLNLEDSVAAVATARDRMHVIAVGLMARWAAATQDGDLTGADFPGWLSTLLGFRYTTGLADRRGECIYSACDHYHKCFVERSVRKAKRARIVVANHALAMIQSALSSSNEDMPSRYIFDEGHHLFDAADGAFAAHLTAQETRDLRRWILGAEGGRRSRARGLKKRAEDLVVGDAQAERALEDIIHHARILTADQWSRRLKEGTPKGGCETFLHLVYKQIYARAHGREGPYSIETPAHPVEPELMKAASALRVELHKLQQPMVALVKLFRSKLANDEGMLDTDTRKRLDAVATSLERRAMMAVAAWGGMLESLEESVSPPEFVDWMEIQRIDGHAVDVGLYRHFIDPMTPFSQSIKPHIHGMAITSATLNDGGEEAKPEDTAAREEINQKQKHHIDAPDTHKCWNTALKRTGVTYLTPSPSMVSYDSPFDYASQTKVFIVNDVNKNSLDQVAGAYRTLFEASGGGALGLFTAISRLRAVQAHIAMALEESGLTLYSQHVDEIDAGTLVDMFRDDVHACLLGTDAVRDGVDVPGESLRLIVFDRVPWPRPSILHKARREFFGGRAYDDMLTRLKLKQAFGRLIRRAGDKGVFVILDDRLPSRLHNAFPSEIGVEKVGLAEVVSKVCEFLN